MSLSTGQRARRHLTIAAAHERPALFSFLNPWGVLMHQQPRDPFQPADPYQQQRLGAEYQQPAAPLPGTSPHAYQPPPQQPRQRRSWPYVLLVIAVAVISFAAGEAAGKSGTTAAPSAAAVCGDAGRHYLSVNSECSWKMTAISQP